MSIKTKFYLSKTFTSVSIFCAMLTTTANAQSISIQQQNDYTVGTAINTPVFAVGDVNNDRLPDLVTLNPNNLSAIGPLSVFLNNGAGGFGAPINVADSNIGTTDAVIADFNRDGNPDLATSATGIANAVHIRLGNGTGNFPTGTSIAAERGSPSIVTADFNGDGNLDLATCNNINELRVLNGNGNGTFAAAAAFATANVCQDLKTADFNVDGRPDLAVSMRLAPLDRAVQTFINNGAGFNAPINNALAAGSPIMAVADFNRDCIPDLAVSEFASTINTRIFIMLGNGSGSLATATTVTLNNTPQQMTVGDFNRDKKVDLAIRHNINNTAGANNLTILPGNGAGGFGTAFAQSIAVAPQSTDMHLATIDANRDGRDDLVIGRVGGFLLYHGNSALFTRTENDFDGDLRTDPSVFRPANGTWYINASTGGLSAAQWGISVDKPAAADYDGDGRTDLAVWRENGFGNTNFSYFFILRSSTNTLQQEQFGTTGDLPIPADYDGDGKADAAVYRSTTGAGGQSLSYYRPSATAGVNFRTFYWGTTGDIPVRGDFDGDGRADAAVFRPSNGVWYVQQSSNGQPLVQSWGLSTDRRVPADYDGDGKTDFAVFRPSNNTWYILNSGNGSSFARQWGTNTDALVPGDYNGDGRTEVAVQRNSEGNWYVPQCGVNRQIIQRFGAGGDIPIPSTLIP
jgi:hypothetical protein